MAAHARSARAFPRRFKPPCLVKYMPDFAAMPFEGTLVIATYCVPTRPGWVRPLANVLHDRDHVLGSTLAERALGVFMAGVLPTWLGHVLSSVVLHQDAGLLYKQSRNLRERGYSAGYSRDAPPVQPEQRPAPATLARRLAPHAASGARRDLQRACRGAWPRLHPRPNAPSC